jgi:hypothetical protein
MNKLGLEDDKRTWLIVACLIIFAVFFFLLGYFRQQNERIIEGYNQCVENYARYYEEKKEVPPWEKGLKLFGSQNLTGIAWKNASANSSGFIRNSS